MEIERRRFYGAAAGAAGGPCRQTPPGVCSGLERRHRRDVALRRIVFQVVRQEWRKNLSAKIQPGIALEFQRTERTAVFYLLAVIPGAHHKKYFVVAGVLRLDRFVDGH